MHEKNNQLSREEERACLRRGMEVIVEASGRRPESLIGDDVPFLLSSGEGTMIELPSDMSLHDWAQYVCLKDFGYMLPIASPQRAMEVFRSEFDAAWNARGGCGSRCGIPLCLVAWPDVVRWPI